MTGPSSQLLGYVTRLTADDRSRDRFGAGWSAEVEAARRYNPCRIDGRVDGWMAPGCAADSAGVRMWPLVVTGRFLAE